MNGVFCCCRRSDIYGARLCASRHTFVGMQIDFLIFDGAPQSLDKDIIAPGSLGSACSLEPMALGASSMLMSTPAFFSDIGEGGAGKLAASLTDSGMLACRGRLICVENIRFAIIGTTLP